MSDAPKFFIVVCAFCGKEKSRVEQAGLLADTVSHGLCKPLCEPAKAKGWGKYVKFEDGGEL